MTLKSNVARLEKERDEARAVLDNLYGTCMLPDTVDSARKIRLLVFSFWTKVEGKSYKKEHPFPFNYKGE
jgi:hypothetical protein